MVVPAVWSPPGHSRRRPLVRYQIKADIAIRERDAMCQKPTQASFRQPGFPQTFRPPGEIFWTAKRKPIQRAGAKHLMLTHLIPPMGATRQGPWAIPGGALTEGDYKKAAQDGGFTGNIVVGTDLVSVRLPAK